MPPKKKRTAPMVVGTVSTRSTRRESIVNIEIIPKSNKSTMAKKSKKSPKSLERNISPKPKTNSEILEILKDWSDEDTSQDEKTISINSDRIECVIEGSTSKDSVSSAADNQSLIDILEGKQIKSEPTRVRYEFQIKKSTTANTGAVEPELIFENPIVYVESPQPDDSAVIEECVVEDESIIIEMSDEHQITSTSRNNFNENNRLNDNPARTGSIEKITNELDSIGLNIMKKLTDLPVRQTEENIENKPNSMDMADIQQTIEKKIEELSVSPGPLQNNEDKNTTNDINDTATPLDNKILSLINLEETVHHSSLVPDEENKSVSSEDTTSQSMITVQDEDVSDNVDIQMSDNSTNTFEIIEEQVICDSTEPIIIDDMDVTVQEFNTEFSNTVRADTEISKGVTTTNDTEETIKSFKKDNEGTVIHGHGRPMKHFDLLDSNVAEKECIKCFNKGDDLIIHCQEKTVLHVESTNPNILADKCETLSKNIETVKEIQTVKKCSSLDILPINNVEDIVLQIPNNHEVQTYNKVLHEGKLITHIKENIKKPLIDVKSVELESVSELISKESLSINKFLDHSQDDTLDENIEKSGLPQSIEHALCDQINESMQLSEDMRNQTIEQKLYDPISETLQQGFKNIDLQSNNKNKTEGKVKVNENVKEKTMDKPLYISEDGKNKTEITAFVVEDIEKNIKENTKSLYISEDNSLKGMSTVMEDTEMNVIEKTKDKCMHISKDKSKIDISSVFKDIEIDMKEKLEDKSVHILGDKNKTETRSEENPLYMLQDDKNKEELSKSIVKDIEVKVHDGSPEKLDQDTLKDDFCQSTIIEDKRKGRKLGDKCKLQSQKTKKDQSLNIEQIEKSPEDSSLEISKKGYKETNRTQTRKSNRKKTGHDAQHLEIDKVKDNEESIQSIKTSKDESDCIIEEKLNQGSKARGKKSQKKSVSSKEPKTKALKESKKKNTLCKKEISENKEKSNTKPGNKNNDEVRRSSRIKFISSKKKRSTHGLVRSKSDPSISSEADFSDSNSVHSELDKFTPITTPQLAVKDKVKSKSRVNERPTTPLLRSAFIEKEAQTPKVDLRPVQPPQRTKDSEIEKRLKSFVHLKENSYKTDKQICKEAREMICDCYLAEEDIQNNEYGCGEDCLNRLLMIECSDLCQVKDRCTNKRFQKGQFAPLEVFNTHKKGLGLRAAANIPYGEFILEYVGEVLDAEEFDKRAEVYSEDKNKHYYFMSLRADAIIDATIKGNISRFINHSCDPNAETQKWTVNGQLRIGFFSTRTILAGEEVTFDYRFQRYGKEAQKCYCEASTCRGWLGERPEESEDEDEEEEEDVTSDLKKATVKELKDLEIDGKLVTSVETSEQKIDDGATVKDLIEDKTPKEIVATDQLQGTPKKSIKKKPRKEIMFEDLDQLNEEIDMLVTTGLKNQQHTLKLSRLMVRAKDLEQRKKLLRVLRRGELPCRRLFLDYHGLRLMHGYMIEAQQLTNAGNKIKSLKMDLLQTKLELLQTLAVLPIQNKTMLIESKVLPAVEKWSENKDLLEESGEQIQKVKESQEEKNQMNEKEIKEKIEEIKFLASKLLEEWANLKESFRIPKKQRIEQMKEHEKEANRKFMASSYGQEQESSRKNEQRYRTWSRYKSERETNKKGSRPEDKDKPSAAFLKISKHERRKLFALQMELKEEERRLKQREMWRQHEMNCMMIGADPRFTAPFDPSKGFQYIWNPSIGQWQALPVPAAQNQNVFNSPASNQGVSGFGVSSSHRSNLLGPYQSPMLNVSGISATTSQLSGITTTMTPIAMPGMTGSITGNITQPPIPTVSMYQEVKKVEEDPSQVKFAGPIPPPVKLPPKWKCAKDKYGRPYYYHIKIRKSQWEPPPIPEETEEYSETSSSETSSLSSETSSESDTDDEIDDTKLLMEVRKQMEKTPKMALKSVIPEHVKNDEKDSDTPSPEIKMESDNEEEQIEDLKEEIDDDEQEILSSIDIRLKEQFNLDNDNPPKKKRRIGLCQEIMISPRTDEDRLQFKEDLKRYKANKEKLKRQKDQIIHQPKKKLKVSSGDDESKKLKDKRARSSVKSRIKELNEWNNEDAKKIKEIFRSSMATTVVSVLNFYRKPDCKEAKITNTEDFKHLARKLTHFVMLKEMKHIEKIDDLVCTENVKAKAREYIRKYMSKFGEVYQKRPDEPDFKD